ncbi:pentatricopeptide repeat-containing protein At1g76280-like isoform X1 [Zingiber officinale]|uniref:pentatricopeptide repeat-containing protein At1g76280-like isoform X1 n=1 Tax=Zingiber officinale TaxID=94328 RepID=UPI001C4DCDF5|nr:pentatricopeptide repeat-containing protein At1g76280-like isoform X1 [Zingiber officinale]
MHRCRARITRQSLADFSNSCEVRKRVRKNGIDLTESSHAFSSSNDLSTNLLGDRLGTRLLQLQVINALRRGDNQQASKFLLNLGEVKDYLNPNSFSYILEYCASKGDPLFAMETWNMMEEKDIALNKRNCSFILQAFSKRGYMEQAFSLLNSLGENDRVHSSLPMFNLFLSGCWSSKSFNYVNHCLGLMETQLVGKSEVTYWELLKLAVLQRSLSSVHEIWKDYARYYNPSAIMLRKFIWSFSRLGDLESANAALKHLVMFARQGSACLSKSASGQYHSSGLDIPIPSKDKLCEKVLLDNPTSLTHSRKPEISVGLEASLEVLDMRHNNDNRNLELEKIFDGQSQSDKVDALVSGTLIDQLISKSGKSKFISEAHEIIDDAVLNNLSFKDKQEAFCDPRTENMKQISKRFSHPLMNLLRWSFNDIIHACAELNNYQLAEQLFLQMLDIGLKPSKHTYDGFVKSAIAGKGVEYGMKVLKMMEEMNIEPYNDTFAVLSIGYSRNFELDLAEFFADKISVCLPKYMYTYNSLFAACGIMGEPERAVRLLVKLKKLNMKLNISTYAHMFSLFGTVNAPYEQGNILSRLDVSKRISAIEMDMANNGIRHSYTSLKNLIKALGAEGMIEEMLQYLNVAENMLWQADGHQKTDMYNVVLHALVQAKEFHKAIEVFRGMRLCSFPANVGTYNMMIECCSVLNSFKSACAILSLMIRDGFCPQILTFTALIKVLLANEDFEGAFSVLDQSRSEGIQPDIQFFNTILRQAFIKGRIDVIEIIIETMHRDKISPDPSSLWYTFTAYVENEFHSTAMEALQVLSMRMISEDSEILQEKRDTFGQLILSEDSDVELQIVQTTFEKSQEFLATALINLRWCAIMGSSISWNPEESPWAKRLANLVSS